MIQACPVLAGSGMSKPHKPADRQQHQSVHRLQRLRVGMWWKHRWAENSGLPRGSTPSPRQGQGPGSPARLAPSAAATARAASARDCRAAFLRHKQKRRGVSLAALCHHQIPGVDP